MGSASGVDLVIADPMVSRLHAELEHRPDGLWIRDLGSTNGTRVNGIRVESACVPDGASLKLGETTLVVNPGAASTSIELWPVDSFGPLVGKSTVMRALFARLARIASTDSTVLIEGETGTGKDIVAHALHEASPRVAKPMVVVDCAALPENLLEAELFGHAKGAFTGAGPARAGAIESADGSTVFLDEVGELPLSMQPKLLRAIESRTVRRLGETAYRTVDVRFVSATHRDLRRMVNAGAFREDLYFRLAVVPVMVPPLREHPEDIEMLVEHFLPSGASDLSSETLGELSSRIVARQRARATQLRGASAGPRSDRSSRAPSRGRGGPRSDPSVSRSPGDSRSSASRGTRALGRAARKRVHRWPLGASRRERGPGGRGRGCGQELHPPLDSSQRALDLQAVDELSSDVNSAFTQAASTSNRRGRVQ